MSAKLTWRELVEMEPRLAQLRHRVAVYLAGRDEEAPTDWRLYEAFKSDLKRLVGYERPRSSADERSGAPRAEKLGSTIAFDVAHREILGRF